MADPQPTPLRKIRDRERDLVVATRRLFDERGMLDAPIEQIAREVGIARGLIYRHFSSKEELYVLTVTDYLDELAGLLEAATGSTSEPIVQLERLTEAYAGFCRRYPAFLDSSLSLMHRPARELNAIVSESIWLRLGRAMAQTIDQLTQVLRDGVAAGTFTIEDPDLTANLLWTQMLGAMHLTRMGVGLRQVAPGVPDLFVVKPEQVIASCVASALATVGARPSAAQPRRSAE